MKGAGEGRREVRAHMHNTENREGDRGEERASYPSAGPILPSSHILSISLPFLSFACSPSTPPPLPFHL
eukprot:scaffold160343_cov35-Tisochrysis_lutea.AAC.4